MTHTDSDQEKGYNLNRRTTLKAVGVAGAGLIGGPALTGSAVGKIGHPGNGPPGRSCEDCPDEMDELFAKYEFEIFGFIPVGTVEVDEEMENVDESGDWLTLEADWGHETVFTIELDDDVYGGWPDNEEQYQVEVVVDASFGECHDEYRFGFHGGDGEEGVGEGGYAKPNFADPGEAPDRQTFHEDDVIGFSAAESDDQHTYTLTVDWDELEFSGAPDDSRDSPGLPESVDIEVFGSDGGEGINGGVPPSSGCIEGVEVEVCDFVFEKGEDLVEITYEFDDDTYHKDGEECEPNLIEFEADGYVIQHVCVYGGRDNDEATIEEEGEELTEFGSDLENPSGQEAAISNVVFCGVEEEVE